MNVDKDTCIGCGACAGVCPVEALAFDDDGKMECDKDLLFIFALYDKITVEVFYEDNNTYIKK